MIDIMDAQDKKYFITNSLVYGSVIYIKKADLTELVKNYMESVSRFDSGQEGVLKIDNVEHLCVRYIPVSLIGTVINKLKKFGFIENESK